MSENAVPFFPGKVWKFKLEFFIKWKVSLNMNSSMHAVIFSKFQSDNYLCVKFIVNMFLLNDS